MTDPADPTVVQKMISEEPLGAAVQCRRDDRDRRVVTSLTPKA
jgi:hypothetical protein